MYTLLETCLNKLDIDTYLSQVIAGLTDDDDIKVQCYLMLVKLSHATPTAVIQRKPALTGIDTTEGGADKTLQVWTWRRNLSMMY